MLILVLTLVRVVGVLDRDGCSRVVNMDLNSLLSRRLWSLAFWMKVLLIGATGGVEGMSSVAEFRMG